MKGTTKVLIVLGALVLVIAVLAACAPSATTNNTTNATPSAPATTSEEASENSSIQTTTEESNPVEVGRTVFDTGKNASGAIAFTEGTDIVKTNGVAPCSECHGTNGKGKKGLGPDITWPAIKSTFSTEALFSQAVTQGKDEAGKALDTKMPRFKMDAADLSAVYAYVKTLQ